MARKGDQFDEYGIPYEDEAPDVVNPGGSQTPSWGTGLPPGWGNPGSSGGLTPPGWDQDVFNQTLFYTDSPGPGFDNYGRPIPKTTTEPPKTATPSTSTVTGERYVNGTEGGGTGGNQTAVQPYRSLDYSAQPIQQTLGPDYSRLTDLLQQMFASQQQRDSENAQYRNSVRSQIQGRLSGLSTPRSLTDPDLSAQSRAFKGGSDRSLRMNREAMAERAHAQGIPSGAVDANLQSSITRSGQNQGAYDAGILGKALTEQRDEIDRLLQLSAGIMSGDEMASLQAHRDQISGQLQNINSQQAGLLGQGELDLRRLLGLGSLDLQGQGLDLQGRQLGQQNSQFYDRLGLDLGNDEFMHNYLLQQLLGAGG